MAKMVVVFRDASARAVRGIRRRPCWPCAVAFSQPEAVAQCQLVESHPMTSSRLIVLKAATEVFW